MDQFGCSQEVAGLDPRRIWQHSFLEVDHEIFSTVILYLPLIQERQVSFGQKTVQKLNSNPNLDRQGKVNWWINSKRAPINVNKWWYANALNKYNLWLIIIICANDRRVIPCPAEKIKMPRPFPIFCQSDYLIHVVDSNSNNEWQQCRSRSVGFFRSQLIGSTLFAKAGYIRVQQDKSYKT